MIVVAVTSIVLEYWLGGHPNRWSCSSAGNLHFFLIGFLLADVYVTGALLRSDRAWRWGVIAVVVWPALFVLPKYGIRTAALFPLAAGLLFVAAFRGAATNRVFCHPLIATIGGMCYGICLVHFGLIGVIGGVVFKHFPSTGSLLADFAIQAPILLVIVLSVAAIYFRLIERPCKDRRWPQKLVAEVRRRFGAEGDEMRPQQG